MPVVPAVTPEIDQLNEILNWIGFSTPTERIAIIDHAFTTCDEIISLKEKYISELAEAFGRRTTSNGRIIFGVSRTKMIKWLVDWAQDCLRVSKQSSVGGLNLPSFLS